MDETSDTRRATVARRGAARRGVAGDRRPRAQCPPAFAPKRRRRSNRRSRRLISRDLSASLLARARDLRVVFSSPAGSNAFMDNLMGAIARRARRHPQRAAHVAATPIIRSTSRPVARLDAQRPPKPTAPSSFALTIRRCPTPSMPRRARRCHHHPRIRSPRLVPAATSSASTMSPPGRTMRRRCSAASAHPAKSPSSPARWPCATTANAITGLCRRHGSRIPGREIAGIRSRVAMTTRHRDPPMPCSPEIRRSAALQSQPARWGFVAALGRSHRAGAVPRHRP